MKWLRLAVAVIVAATILTTASAATLQSDTSQLADCTPAAIANAFTGTLALESIASFGCSQNFAYVWATVGQGVAQISVTEVLRFDQQTQRWSFVSRQEYCVVGRLPAFIYRKGCFSN